MGRGNKSLFVASGSHDQIAATPINGKENIQKSSSLDPVDRFPRNLVCSIGDSDPS